MLLIRQEAELSWGENAVSAEVPDHLIEVLARFTRLVRESPAVDVRSGVSARFARRWGRDRRRLRAAPCRAHRRGVAVARVCDLPAVVPSLRGKVEFEVSEEGREDEVLAHLLRRAIAETFRSRLGGSDLVGAAGEVRGRGHRRDRRPRARRPSCCDASARWTAWPRCSSALGDDGGETPGARGRARVRARGAVPDPADQQGRAARPHGLRRLTDGPAHRGLPLRRLARRARPARAAVRRPRRARPGRRRGPRGVVPREALRDLLRRGPQGLRGLDDMLRRSASGGASSASAGGSTARCRRRASCSTGRSGRSAPRCSPTRPTTRGSARPSSTRCRATPRAPCVSSPSTTGAREAARETFEQIRDLLRREVLDQQFRGMKQALEGAAGDPTARMQRVKDMMPTSTRCSTPTRAASTRRSSSTSSWTSTASSSRTHPEPRGARRLPRPPRRRGAAADGVAVGRAARTSSPT